VAVRIARVETFLVPPRWLLCRVETDDGVTGWGEPVAGHSWRNPLWRHEDGGFAEW
jgi:L-alanine-DL-glutamate epimerase-like enolase superfamily enzyme